MNTCAPVVIFAYNRPAHLQKTIHNLKADPLAINSDLIIFSDNAKKYEDNERVKSVRSLISNIHGFKSISVIEREINYGLARSISEGVTSILEKYNKIIVLEDDLLVRPGFLAFMNRALERYVHESKVYQISGYSYPGNFAPQNKTFFLPITSCWGWGAWKRSWDVFNFELKDLEDIEKDLDLAYKFNVNNTYNYLKMAKEQKVGKLNSWGICWYLNVFMLGGLILYPRDSFVQNIGVDSSGTHGNGHSQLQKKLFGDPPQLLDSWFSENIFVDELAYNEVAKTLKSMQQSRLNKFYNWIFK